MADLYDEARQQVADAQLGLIDDDGLEGILSLIETKAREDLAATLEDRREISEAEGDELLASIEAWASLASEATFAAYAGPSREVGAAKLTLPGWAKGVGKKLSDLAKLLRHYLEVVAKAIGATSFSIQMSFPWGVAVGLGWG